MAARTGVALVLLAVMGCTIGPSAEVQRKLEELSAVSAEKDRLLRDVVDNAKLMSDISTALATVDFQPAVFDAASSESPSAAARDSIRLMIENVTTRVSDSEARLRDSRRRIRALTAVSDSLRTQLEETVSNFESVIVNQRETIGRLTQHVERLEAENLLLAQQRAALKDSVEAMEILANTAYYIIGTKDDLKDRGIVVEEGGSRVLFIFGRRGRTLRPALELDANDFIAIDQREVTEILLPNAEKKYRIASRQNATFLEVPPDDDGKITGNLIITSPDEFWEASKFLIIIES